MDLPNISSTNKLLDRVKKTLLFVKGARNRYTKKFDAYTHLINYLYAVLCRYDSINKVVVGPLSNATKLHHLGINYCVKRFVNINRGSKFFADIFSMLLSIYSHFY